MKNLLIKFLLLFTACFSVACTADYQVIQDRETKVIVDFQSQPNKIESLDVLVVLDTSGSMGDNYDDVADGMDLLRTDIESLTLDYRFGYVTMDPNSLSYIGPYDISSSAIDMLMAPSLLPMTTLEEGFAATYSFFTQGVEYEFRRPEADLLLFLISDENEQSAITADLFYDWMHDEFKDVNHDVVTITQLEDSDCGYTYDIGYKYEELANLYNKDPIDICAEDWSVWLSDSSYLTTLSNIVYLTSDDPIVETIVVYVDSTPSYDWHYNSSSNSVIFDIAPPHGVEVVVAYEVFVD
jgi:hypothetical protein